MPLVPANKAYELRRNHRRHLPTQTRHSGAPQVPSDGSQRQRPAAGWPYSGPVGSGMIEGIVGMPESEHTDMWAGLHPEPSARCGATERAREVTMLTGKVTRAAACVVAVVVIAFAALPAEAATTNAPQVFPEDRVYVQNRASDLWNVAGPVERLDNYSPLDLVYVDRCPFSSQCVTVVEVDLPDWPITVARTRMFALDGHTHHTVIELDPVEGRKATGRKRYHTVIHELGHSVGLNHTGRKGSIMQSFQTSITTPDGTDYANLRRLY
jgi:Matrixin